MISLANQPGEFRFTLQIKRAATGETETVEMVGRTAHDEDEVPQTQSETQEK
jgi:hypothetical protein